MDPFDFLDTAERLASNLPRTEADNRTIVGRLYYALFQALFIAISARNPGVRAATVNGTSSHTLVREYLKGQQYRADGRRGNYFGNRVNWYERLEKLRKGRENADYDLELPEAEIAVLVDDLIDEAALLKPHVEEYVR